MSGFNPLQTPIDFILLAEHRRPNGPPANDAQALRQSPGIAEVKGAADVRMWDKRQAYGLAGATQIFRGRDLAEFDVTLTLTTDDDWDAWASWRTLVARPPFGKIPKALDIWHPWLEEMQIRSCVVLSRGQPEPDGTGAFRIPIKFREFRPFTFALSKPTSSATPTDNDPFSQQIAANSDMIKQLTQQLAK